VIAADIGCSDTKREKKVKTCVYRSRSLLPIRAGNRRRPFGLVQTSQRRFDRLLLYLHTQAPFLSTDLPIYSFFCPFLPLDNSPEALGRHHRQSAAMLEAAQYTSPQPCIWSTTDARAQTHGTDAFTKALSKLTFPEYKHTEIYKPKIAHQLDTRMQRKPGM
jgi:hypothetical protein